MKLPTIRECGLYNADLLLGDHVCETPDAIKWIDCHDYLLFDYIMLISYNRAKQSARNVLSIIQLFIQFSILNCCS